MAALGLELEHILPWQKSEQACLKRILGSNDFYVRSVTLPYYHPLTHPMPVAMNYLNSNKISDNMKG